MGHQPSENQDEMCGNEDMGGENGDILGENEDIRYKTILHKSVQIDL